MQGWKCCWLRYCHEEIMHPLPPCNLPHLRICSGALPHQLPYLHHLHGPAAVSPCGAVLQSYAKNMGLYGGYFPAAFPCC